MALGSGLDLHGVPDAVGPLASTAGIDVTACHLPRVARARLDPDDIRGPAGRGKNLTPEGSRGTLGRWIRIRITIRHPKVLT